MLVIPSEMVHTFDMIFRVMKYVMKLPLPSNILFFSRVLNAMPIISNYSDKSLWAPFEVMSNRLSFIGVTATGISGVSNTEPSCVLPMIVIYEAQSFAVHI